MSTTKISVSSELMKNYKQATIMTPEKKFEALQTGVGNSMLFSIGTDNVFYVTQESPNTQTGWEKTDLSSALVQSTFSGDSAICKTFEAVQSVVDGTIGIAMAISDSSEDNLFLCLGNSNTDTSWISNPSWVNYPYDNPDKPMSQIIIVNIEISETVNDTQYILVDILRDPSSPEQLISRYYIDTKKTNGGYAWQAHDISIDLEANQYISCLGRQYLSDSPHQPIIDGLYTCGQVDGEAQFIFQPLYNVFNPKLPAPSARLNLPDELVPTCIASCRKSDLSTDLYVTSGDALYYFASSNQNDGSTAVLILQNELLVGVSKMFAVQVDNIVTLWGLNGNDQIFYITCPVGEETNAALWSIPLPILTDVDMFSPYINAADYGNTFFAVSGNTLQKLIKSSETSLWTSQCIALPTLDTNETQQYNSYTTTIQLTDENDQAVANALISIKANTRCGVYINHLYYVVDSTGITVNTDQFGNITVIEWVDGLTGTQLIISGSSDGKVSSLNPMNGSMQKIAALNTVSSLQNAVITNDDGSTVPLVDKSISDKDLQVTAQSNIGLGNAYNHLSANGSSALKGGRYGLKLAMSTPQGAEASDFLNALWVDAGDLFRWLKSGVEAFVEIIEDAANKVWNFVVTIAGKVYACVLDVVEKVVEAAVWVFNVIKTAIEDLIKFLQFLFGWQDILTTHKVMKNVIIQFSQQSINNLSDYKADLAAMFQSLQSNINQWANIPNFDQTPASVTASNQALGGQNSSPANLGIHHFQGNASSVSSTIDPGTVSETIFQDLISLMESEGTTLAGACEAIKTDIIDQINSLSMSQIIQKFMAILADTLIQTAENVMEAALNVFIQLTQGIMDLLTAKLDIPVLSWLYKEISGEDLSFLDLICLIGAIPATIIYKISAGIAPFPQGDTFSESMINADSFDEIQALFYTSAEVYEDSMSPAYAITGLATSASQTPVLNQTRLKVFGFTTGVFAFLGSGVLIIVTGIQRILDELPFDNPIPKTLATIAAIANVAYVSPNIATFINTTTDNWYQQLNNALTGVSLIKGFINIPIAVASKPIFGQISAFTESFINVVWNVPVVMNIVENYQYWNSTYKSLIPESIGNFCFNFGGIMEFPIALTTDLKAKAIESAIQFGLMLLYGVFMPIAGGIYSFAENQDH